MSHHPGPITKHALAFPAGESTVAAVAVGTVAKTRASADDEQSVRATVSAPGAARLAAISASAASITSEDGLYQPGPGRPIESVNENQGDCVPAAPAC